MTRAKDESYIHNTNFLFLAAASVCVCERELTTSQVDTPGRLQSLPGKTSCLTHHVAVTLQNP